MLRVDAKRLEHREIHRHRVAREGIDRQQVELLWLLSTSSGSRSNRASPSTMSVVAGESSTNVKYGSRPRLSSITSGLISECGRRPAERRPTRAYAHAENAKVDAVRAPRR